MSQDIEYGDVVSSIPKLLPSNRNCTPATPTASDAVALAVTLPDTVPDAGAVSETVGAVVSDGVDPPPVVVNVPVKTCVYKVTSVSVIVIR